MGKTPRLPFTGHYQVVLKPFVQATGTYIHTLCRHPRTGLFRYMYIPCVGKFSENFPRGPIIYPGRSDTRILASVHMLGRLDRKALVSRHHPRISCASAAEYDPKDFLSLGNGEFAINVDFTGLQTFNDTLEAHPLYNPLNTMAHWGWHTTPVGKSPTPSARPEAFALQPITANGKTAGYPTGCPPLFAGACKYGSLHNQTATTAWLRANPHRLNLARLHLEVNGSLPDRRVITAINQTLDLWSGRLESRFRIGGDQVVVVTAVHPTRDVVTFQIESKLISDGMLTVGIGFPYGSEAMQGNGADWQRPSDHSTAVLSNSSSPARAEALFGRALDGDGYQVSVRSDGVQPKVTMVRSHAFRLSAGKGTRLLSAAVEFAPVWDGNSPPPFERVVAQSASAWEAFWQSGAAIDFSGSSDARALELEGRLVLSQWASRTMEAGSLPPAETGLTGNSWYGKFHGEMYMWHCAHHIAWGRPSLFERSFGYYSHMLPEARAYAALQGYKGARWFKMRARQHPASADPLSAYTGPSPVGPLLIQQQTHPIMYSELLYRHNPSSSTLDKYGEIVESTAEFMASFALQAEGHNTRGCLNLGPPMAPGMGVEVDDPGNSYNWTGTLNGVYENTCTPACHMNRPPWDAASLALSTCASTLDACCSDFSGGRLALGARDGTAVAGAPRAPTPPELDDGSAEPLRAAATGVEQWHPQRDRLFL